MVFSNMKTVPAAGFRNRLRVDNSVCFLAALLIMTVPLKWLLASIMAAVLHELGHICAVRLCKGTIRDVEIRLGGVCMYSVPMKPLHSILCIAAGPVTSFSLLFLIHLAPRIAICGFAQGLFNLLPIMPLDGGRLLREFINLFGSPKTASRICNAVEILTLIVLGSWILITAVFCQSGVFAVLLYLGFLYSRIKRPCKESKMRVQ